MTCKDCIHYEVCQYHITEETEMTVNECGKFKNKADFVEVVRCKDCVYRQPIDADRYNFEGRPAMHCILQTNLFGEKAFCSEGKRKGGAE